MAPDVDVDGSGDSSILRLLPSCFLSGVSLRVGAEREVPNPGDVYLFLGFALPPPRHTQVPLGFLLSIRGARVPLATEEEEALASGAEVILRTVVEKRNGTGGLSLSSSVDESSIQHNGISIRASHCFTL